MKIENREFLTVTEVSELLSINEKKIYALLKEGRIPGTKVTGKWLFPKNELKEFIRIEPRMTLKKLQHSPIYEKHIVLIAGSDDPVMCVIQGVFHSLYRDYLLLASVVGSEEGLRLLNRGFCNIALCHLYDSITNDFNFTYMERLLDDPDRFVVLNLFYRTIGFVSRDIEVGSFGDVVGNNLRFINRQEGSGVRHRVDEIIQKEGLGPEEISGYDEEVYTHLDVITHILSGKADAGIAAESAASLPGIHFRRLYKERFDMVVLKDSFFKEKIQLFVEFIRSDRFLTILKGMKGYDCCDTGRVMYPKQLL